MTSALVSLSIVVGVVIAAAVVWAVIEGRRYRRSAERLIADYDADPMGRPWGDA